MLDERQAAIMKAQGYQWDAERRRWYRGDPARRARAECRSGGRFVRFVDAEGETATGCSPAVTAAVERFASVVQSAREESVSLDREADLDFKNRLSSKLAPAVWLTLQALTLAAAQASLAPHWGARLQHCSPYHPKACHQQTVSSSSDALASHPTGQLPNSALMLPWVTTIRAH